MFLVDAGGLSKLRRASWSLWSLQIRFGVHFQIFCCIFFIEFIFGWTVHFLRCLNACARLNFFSSPSIRRWPHFFCLGFVFASTFQLLAFLHNGLLNCVFERLRNDSLSNCTLLRCVLLGLRFLLRLGLLRIILLLCIVVGNGTSVSPMVYGILSVRRNCFDALRNGRLALDT